MRVAVDESRCIGCGACVDTCPGVFALAPGTVAVVLADGCEGHEDSVREAGGGCPQGAIGVDGE